MKKAAVLSVIMMLLIVSEGIAQDSRALRAARMSFNSAERNYNRGNYQEAAREFEIVINTIPANTDSRRHLEMRLESLIAMVDIYFYRFINITNACQYMNMFFDNMNTIRNSGMLRASSLRDFQRKEQEFRSEHATKCDSYQNIERDMEEFRKRFEEEFD